MNKLTRAEIRQLIESTEKKIKYSHNWNGKLSFNNYYTSIRRSNNYYKPGDYFLVFCNDSLDHLAKLINKKTFLLHELPEFTAYLDTGMSLSETKALFNKMYPGTDWNVQKLDLLLFKNVEL